MTPVYDAGLEKTRPQVHALVIGVGRYPHLLDGTGKIWPENGGMGQLTSPPQSARAIATFLCEEWVRFAPPDASPSATGNVPLGSVQLLLSEAAPTPFAYTDSQSDESRSVDVQSATFAHIAEAFALWYERLDEDEGNVGIFYFCGHGLEKEGLALLPEDFAASLLKPYDTAIDIDETRIGMRRCKASNQLYFLDVCRKVTKEAMQNRSFGGRTLIEASLTQREPQNALVYYATEHGSEAFGQRDESSRFTTALLQVLRGAGATYEAGNHWRLGTSGIGKALVDILQRENEGLAGHRRQNAKIGGTSGVTRHLFTYPSPPALRLQVSCQPTLANPLAHFSLQQGSFFQERRPDPLAGAWRLQVPGGIYDLEVAFAETGYRPIKRPEFLFPPSTDIDLEVE